MSKTAEHIDDARVLAGWPPESMDTVMLVSEQVGLYDLAAELEDRSGRAGDGWRGCLVAAGENHSTLCEPCHLTTNRDRDSDEMERS